MEAEATAEAEALVRPESTNRWIASRRPELVRQAADEQQRQRRPRLPRAVQPLASLTRP